MSALAKALLAFQKDPPPIHLDATNPHFNSKFASLGGVVAAVRPALTKHGLVVTQLPTVTADGAPALETRLIHAESGEALSSHMPLLAAKQDPQAQGSALTYARRYALLAILGLVGDADDDANGAQPRNGASRGDARVAAAVANAPNAADVTVHFGTNSGKRLGDLTKRQLEWYAHTWTPNPDFANDQDQWLKAAAQLLVDGVAAPAATDDLSDIPF